ncbi:hypothetical protein VE23_15020 [Paenibacillus sp. D9]|nr:hypothetical protein VE23_15020 [Paenibacillus sp. D9]
MTIFLFLLLIFLQNRYKRMNNSVFLGFILSLLLLSQSVGQLYDNYKWHGYTNEIKSVLASSNAGILDKDDMNSRIRDSSFILPWTLPSLSIALSDGYKLKTLMVLPENEGEFGVNREKELIHIPNIDLNPNVFIYPELIGSIQNYDLFRHPYHLGDLIDFSGSLDNLILTGWSKPENWGRWTIGGESQIKLVVSPMDLGKPLELRAEAAGFVADKPQKVKIYVNDVFADSWIFNNNDEWSQRRLNVSSDLIRSNQPLKISFYIEMPSSPKESNRGDDQRKLGLAIKNITIDQQ